MVSVSQQKKIIIKCIFKQQSPPQADKAQPDHQDFSTSSQRNVRASHKLVSEECGVSVYSRKPQRTPVSSIPPSVGHCYSFRKEGTGRFTSDCVCHSFTVFYSLAGNLQKQAVAARSLQNLLKRGPSGEFQMG